MKPYSFLTEVKIPFEFKLDVIDPFNVTNEQKKDICFLLEQIGKDHLGYDKVLGLSRIKDSLDFPVEKYDKRILSSNRIDFQRFFVCTCDNKIVGLIHYAEHKEGMDEYRGKCGWFTSIVVHPGFRRMGIGSRLMEFCKDWIKKNRPSIKVFLGVSCGNPGGLALYAKYGFKPVHQTMVCKI